jgi:hypothetical protein
MLNRVKVRFYQMNLSSVLKPLADSQSERILTEPPLIQRIPPLVDRDGEIIPEFQEFYTTLVTCIVYARFDQLWELTDKLLTVEDFTATCERVWGDIFSQYKSTAENSRGLDIELNMTRFRDIYRNIIAGFCITTFYINVSDDEFGRGKLTKLTQASTELLFTFRNDEFQIITDIKPFIVGGGS